MLLDITVLTLLPESLLFVHLVNLQMDCSTADNGDAENEM